jgi:Predicted membrane protein (DUF2254)
VGLAGFVVTVTVLAIQMATGTFSARYMRIWYRDRLLKAVLTVLAGTLTFSFSLLRQVSTTRAPNIGVAEGLVVEDPLDWPAGSTWLLQRSDRGQVYGRLLAPLALEGLKLAGP